MARTIWAIWVPKLFLFARVFSLVRYNIIFCCDRVLTGLSCILFKNKMFISERLNPATAFPQQFCIVQEVTRVLRKISCNAIPSESQKEGSVELKQNKIQPLSYCWLGTSLWCYVMWSCEMRQSPFVQRRASSDSKNADWLTFVINLKTTIPVQVIIGGADNVWNVCMKAAEWHRNISLPVPVSKKMTFARSPTSDKTIICHFLSLLQVPLSYRE